MMALWARKRERLRIERPPKKEKRAESARKQKMDAKRPSIILVLFTDRPCNQGRQRKTYAAG